MCNKWHYTGSYGTDFPEVGENVLVVFTHADGSKEYGIGHYEKEDGVWPIWYVEEYGYIKNWNGEVVYWMPLPEMPED